MENFVEASRRIGVPEVGDTQIDQTACSEAQLNRSIDNTIRSGKLAFAFHVTIRF